ncbi:general stress protein [Filobacillus milosensis]|uniref:General stress protein n=1 Tax=Filobacillus milosensis TaxID=94137 RepID=A0A4Y8IE82_9BACI|nr:general stress protein [Filobacillus milosensis]TFB13379.1 general stress protein [Filobacillus milosensis]
MPFVREYINDEKLIEDIQKLKDNGINNSEVYVLSHDDDRTDRIASNAKANTIGLSEQDMKTFLNNMFSKKGDELRTKLQEMGFSKDEAEEYEEDMDEGKVLLIVQSDQDVDSILH